MVGFMSFDYSGDMKGESCESHTNTQREKLDSHHLGHLG